MFEDVCLACGKPLQHDSQAYCSEDCQISDSSSPSISSASSALSSPSLGYAVGGDVPALVPSALSSALLKQHSFHRRNQYSISSSSSTTSWSGLTDDDNDDSDSVFNSSYDPACVHGVDTFYEGSSKSANFAYPAVPSALSYARRPSGTNNGSSLLPPHKRTPSTHVHDIPQSAPLETHSYTDDDGVYSDVGFSSRDESDAERQPPFSSSKPKRTTRNRTSLPGYFSLLQISPSDHKRTSVSGHTIARPSPPTPKLTLTGPALVSLSASATHSTPRGRRRVHEESLVGRRLDYSRSRSRSVSRRRESEPFPVRYDNRPSVEQTFDWSVMPGYPQGRAPVRRNSSPPPKMVLSRDEHAAVFVADGAAETLGYRKTRGRVRTDSDDVNAPGFGNGRSGLLDRERSGRLPTVPL